MTTTPSLRASAFAAALLAFPAAAQTPPPAAAVAPGVVVVNDQAAQDRIMALVRAGKCGAAKTEATRVGDTSLAEQIGTMCGAHNANPFAPRGGGGGGGKSGGSSGRRGGGGGA